MTIPFYVPPEQQMKDRADFARAGIARGRSVVVLRYRDGLCFAAENHSTTLHKISEIYDRIAFAAVGRYNEFEALRVAGIQQADLRGYTYARSDVTARALVNVYAQVMGAAFAAADKPFEVELAVGEVGADAASDRIFRVTYDGSVFDEPNFAVMGGQTEALVELLAFAFDPDADQEAAVRLAANALRATSAPDAPLEVALLDRTRPGRRAFARLAADRVESLVGGWALP